MSLSHFAFLFFILVERFHAFSWCCAIANDPKERREKRKTCHSAVSIFAAISKIHLIALGTQLILQRDVVILILRPSAMTESEVGFVGKSSADKPHKALRVLGSHVFFFLESITQPS
jgi:hypothetical protein